MTGDNDTITLADGGSRPGERNSQSLLTDAETVEIFKSTSKPAETARRYGVSIATVWAIRSGQRRAHLTQGAQKGVVC